MMLVVFWLGIYWFIFWLIWLVLIVINWLSSVSKKISIGKSVNIKWYVICVVKFVVLFLFIL